MSNTSYFVKQQSIELLSKYRIAGKVAADALSLLENLVKEKTTKSLIEIAAIINDFIVKNGCNPIFLGYRGFPSALCCSVGKILVHGIPDDYRLQDGDVISFDLGTEYDGCIGDAARTFIFGKPKCQEHIDLITVTKAAFFDAVNVIKIGQRLGVIGAAIIKCALNNNLSVIDHFGGHFLGRTEDGKGVLHVQPFIANRDRSDNGIRLVPNMVFAIEPLFVIGKSSKTTLGSDGWAVSCLDICSHYENSIWLHEDRVEILTI